jgi:hypothetical protein
MGYFFLLRQEEELKKTMNQPSGKHPKIQNSTGIILQSANQEK